ncbi:MAG TPA: hypothetical protein VFK23_02755 [Nitrospirota bacterium]|nr:hypothetical protein [Nitrospirota bacterium]
MKTKGKIGGAVMLEEFRGWIHRHFNVVLSFVVGLTSGISILALVYFSTRNDIAARALRYGVQITGDIDIAEDLLWFICGIVVGASVICLAWWRDSKAQLVGLEKADVLNRILTDPKPPIVRKEEKEK